MSISYVSSVCFQLVNLCLCVIPSLLPRNQVPLEGSLPVRCELLLRTFLCWASGRIISGDPLFVTQKGYQGTILVILFLHQNQSGILWNYHTPSTCRGVILTYPDKQHEVLKLVFNSWNYISMGFPSLGPKATNPFQIHTEGWTNISVWEALYFNSYVQRVVRKPKPSWCLAFSRSDDFDLQG